MFILVAVDEGHQEDVKVSDDRNASDIQIDEFIPLFFSRLSSTSSSFCLVIFVRVLLLSLESAYSCTETHIHARMCTHTNTHVLTYKHM